MVIGQDVWEKDESTRSSREETMGQKMTYRVALDDKTDTKEGAMVTTWMNAVGQSGIPTAFLVDKQGRIAWIGHPMGLKEEVIEQVLEGKFDIAKAKGDYRRQKEAEAETSRLSQQAPAKLAVGRGIP